MALSDETRAACMAEIISHIDFTRFLTMVFEDSTEVCISACCPMTPPYLQLGHPSGRGLMGQLPPARGFISLLYWSAVSEHI